MLRKQLLIIRTTTLLACLLWFRQLSCSYSLSYQSSVVHQISRDHGMETTMSETEGRRAENLCYLCNGTNEIPYPNKIAFPATIPGEEEKKCSDVALEAVFISGDTQVCAHYQFIGYTRCGCDGPSSSPSSTLSSKSLPSSSPTSGAVVSSLILGDEDMPPSQKSIISFWFGIPIGIVVGCIIVFVIVLLRRRKTASHTSEKEKVISKKNRERSQKYDMVFLEQEEIDAVPNNVVAISKNKSSLTDSSDKSTDSLFRMEEAFPVPLFRKEEV